MGCTSSKRDGGPSGVQQLGKLVTKAQEVCLRDAVAASLRERLSVKSNVESYAMTADSDLVDETQMFCLSPKGILAERLRDVIKRAGYGSLLSPVSADSVGDELEGKSLRAIGEAITIVPALANELPISLLPYAPTAADTCITDDIGVKAARLVRDGFRAHSTGHSCVIAGQRGSGKSHALQRVAVTAALHLEALRVVWFNAQGLSSARHPLHSGLCRALLDLGLTRQPLALPATDSQATASPSTSSTGSSRAVSPSPSSADGVSTNISRTLSDSDVLLRSLIMKRIRLVVLIDEVEALYEEDSDAAFAILRELQILSTTPSGVISVVCVTSSSLGYSLINGGNIQPPEMQRELFHLTRDKRIPDLNGEKLRLRRIPPALPSDASAFAPFCVLGPGGLVPPEVLFAVGPHVRSLYLRRIPRTSAPSTLLQSSAETSAYARLFLVHNPSALVLLESLYDALAAQNSELLLDVLTPAKEASNASLLDRIRVSAVRTIDWATAFKPLSGGQVMSIARIVWAPAQLDATLYANILSFLCMDTPLFICGDRSSDGPIDFVSSCLWPSSPLAVLLHAQWRKTQKISLDDAMQATKMAVSDASSFFLRAAVTTNTWERLADRFTTLLANL